MSCWKKLTATLPKSDSYPFLATGKSQPYVLRITSLQMKGGVFKRMAKRGLGSPKVSAQRRREIASMGGRSQGRENNPGNFARDTEKASRAGKIGGSR